MPKKKNKMSKEAEKAAFENAHSAPTEWLKHDQPLLCEAVRMQPDADPWERKGKILRADATTEKRRKKLQELSLNVEHFISDESGAAVA